MSLLLLNSHPGCKFGHPIRPLNWCFWGWLFFWMMVLWSSKDKTLVHYTNLVNALRCNFWKSIYIFLSWNFAWEMFCCPPLPRPGWPPHQACGVRGRALLSSHSGTPPGGVPEWGPASPRPKAGKNIWRGFSLYHEIFLPSPAPPPREPKQSPG